VRAAALGDHGRAICDDGRDNDGNGAIDCADGACSALCDADGDEHVALSRGGDDCDDGNGAIHPGAIEICNGVDDDCDGLTDDADTDLDATTGTAVWSDGDGDGWGGDPVGSFCAPPTGTSAQAGDCDDGDADVHPDGMEVCNRIDDDCDGVDEACASVLVGRFQINDGPSWTSDPPTYSCVEACALLFGGLATSYECGTDIGGADNMAFLDGWADETYCTTPKSETYKKNTHYDCGAVGCSYSVYVTDHDCGSYNYCYEK
jgi:hypothetical protein